MEDSDRQDDGEESNTCLRIIVRVSFYPDLPFLLFNLQDSKLRRFMER